MHQGEGEREQGKAEVSEAGQTSQVESIIKLIIQQCLYLYIYIYIFKNKKTGDSRGYSCLKDSQASLLMMHLKDTSSWGSCGSMMCTWKLQEHGHRCGDVLSSGDSLYGLLQSPTTILAYPVHVFLWSSVGASSLMKMLV